MIEIPNRGTFTWLGPKIKSKSLKWSKKGYLVDFSGFCPDPDPDSASDNCLMLLTTQVIGLKSQTRHIYMIRAKNKVKKSKMVKKRLFFRIFSGPCRKNPDFLKNTSGPLLNTTSYQIWSRSVHK